MRRDVCGASRSRAVENPVQAWVDLNGNAVSIEVRDYRGDFADVHELAQRVWSATYGGKTLFPLWDAAFLQWQLGAQSHALLPAAYDGTKLRRKIPSPVAGSKILSCPPEFSNAKSSQNAVIPDGLHGRRQP